MLKTVLLVAVFALVGVSGATQLPLTSNASSRNQAPKGFRRLITPELSAHAEQLIAGSLTPGLSLGVIQLDRSKKDVQTEFGAWGNRTEDGDKTTQDVSCASLRVARLWTYHIADPLRHWFLLQGVPRGCYGDLDGSFLARKEQYPFA